MTERRSKFMTKCGLISSVVLLAMFLASGCTSWPFVQKDRTSFITPPMRVSSIREIGARAGKADADEQDRMTQQLATQIQTEPDPLVRQAIQESISEYPTALARQVLIAGLQDEDIDVRITCCQRLGGRSDDTVVGSLRAVLEREEELDVKLAAIDALGRIQTSESLAAIGVALNDRDPAMQYAAIEALKSVSDQDLGNDVVAWREFVNGSNGPISVANKKEGFLRF